jgi:hypothetical protein
MTCFAVLVLACVILFVSLWIALGLLSIGVGVIIIAVVAALAFLLYFWRVIYPWLVRMGRWSAQLRNTIFLLAVLLGGVATLYIIPQLGIKIPTVLLIVLIILGILFVFLLLLAMVVWLVRLWRRGWPLARNFFWDTSFRIVALFWRILVGIPLGITWFLYHPPLRWLIAALLFYLRGIAAAAAWLVYNPPLRSILKAVGFITGLIGRVVAAILYNPPILWLVQAMLFVLRVIIRPISAIIYGIMSWWPITGVKGTLKKGLTTESKSYQDYKYAGTGPL